MFSRRSYGRYKSHPPPRPLQRRGRSRMHNLLRPAQPKKNARFRLCNRLLPLYAWSHCASLVCTHLHAEDSPTRFQPHSARGAPNADARIRRLLSPNMFASFMKPLPRPRFNGTRCPVRYKVSFRNFRTERERLLNEIVMSLVAEEIPPATR